MRTLDSIKLADKERASVFQAAKSLKSELPISKVILFGSRARGTAVEHSDIDLLILTSCPVNSRLRSIVSEKLAELNIENDVVLSSVVVYEKDWLEGLIHYMPIYSEVQRDGYEV
jgi:predicted nucleotidyltransferase